MSQLFFALWPDADARRQIASISEQIHSECGRRVPVDNLHITLVFLRSIDEKKRDCVLESADKISCSRINLELDHLGWWKKAQVVWLAPSSIPIELESLAGALVSKAGQCGIRVDDRPYKPHMTLARKVRKNPHLPANKPVHWAVGKFALIESINTPDGVKYVPVWTSA